LGLQFKFMQPKGLPKNSRCCLRNGREFTSVEEIWVSANSKRQVVYEDTEGQPARESTRRTSILVCEKGKNVESMTRGEKKDNVNNSEINKRNKEKKRKKTTLIRCRPDNPEPIPRWAEAERGKKICDGGKRALQQPAGKNMFSSDKKAVWEKENQSRTGLR